MKQQYSEINRNQKDLIAMKHEIETENRSLKETIERIREEKNVLKQNLQEENRQLTELNEHQKDELVSIHRSNENEKENLQRQIGELQQNVREYETTIEQYDQYRIKVEENLRKLVQQRDKYKNDWKLTRDVLTEKEKQIARLSSPFQQNQNLQVSSL